MSSISSLQFLLVVFVPFKAFILTMLNHIFYTIVLLLDCCGKNTGGLSAALDLLDFLEYLLLYHRQQGVSKKATSRKI